MSNEIVILNAQQIPGYAPYCMTSGCMRMVKVAEFLWKCNRCGNVCDLREEAKNAQ